LPPVAEAKPAEQPAAQITAAAVAATPAQDASTTAPASPVAADAAKQAEVASAEAEKEIEKARQDALAHFEFDSAELTPVGRAMLDDWLKQASTNDPILVTGHADRLGPEPYNEKLSQMRADSVRKYLIEKGKPANRIVIQAKGEKFPLISCSGAPTDATIACLAPNRRAEVVYKPGVRKAARTATKLVKPKSRR
jgi:outer membrane protein OmpA-like peptidoglycan-associated protein